VPIAWLWQSAPAADGILEVDRSLRELQYPVLT